MSLRDTIRQVEHDVLDYVDQDHKTRSHRLAELERKLHAGFDSWTSAHKARYPRMGQLPYQPFRYKDQRLDRPFRPINKVAVVLAKAERSQKIRETAKPAIYLGSLAYLAAVKEFHAKTVGSKAVSRTMIEAFHATPAHDSLSETISMVDYTVQCLDNPEDMTIGLTSAHLRELADIGEFSSALNIAIAEEYGLRYMDRVNTTINNNMTRQTYRVGLFDIPIARLATLGTGVFWGTPPGESAKEHGIEDEELIESNKQLSRAFSRMKKEQSMVMAYVPSGSGAKRVVNEHSRQLEKVVLKDASYTAPITVRCRGGIIVVNREGDEIAISPVIPNNPPEGMGNKTYQNILTDSVMEEHAAQAHELTGAPVEFTRLHTPLMQDMD